MKKSKNFKLILMILICIVLILVGFIGIYTKRGNTYKNILPKYKFASDLTKSTVLEFEIDEGTETVYLDKDGKEVDVSDITEENQSDYIEKEVVINEKETLNSANYKTALKIMKERLGFLKADQYKLDLDERTGKIVLTFEDDYPDDIKSIISREGKFELIDSNTNDVILDYSDFSLADTTYATIDQGNEMVYVVYINLKLNDSGIEKINNIDKYKTTTDSESNETTINKFKILFDDEKIKEIAYDDLELQGKTLRIMTADDLTSNSEINSELNLNTVITKLATIGKMPVVYNIVAEQYINSVIVDYIDYIIIAFAIVSICISIYFIIKYKCKGILVIISSAANIALFLILIRLTDIRISLNGFAALAGLIVLNTILLENICKCLEDKDKTFADNIKKAYIDTIDLFIVSLIIFVVFAFSNMTVINSMGLLMFWGWLMILVGNLALTVPILLISNKK